LFPDFFLVLDSLRGDPFQQILWVINWILPFLQKKKKKKERKKEIEPLHPLLFFPESFVAYALSSFLMK